MRKKSILLKLSISLSIYILLYVLFSSINFTMVYAFNMTNGSLKYSIMMDQGTFSIGTAVVDSEYQLGNVDASGNRVYEFKGKTKTATDDFVDVEETIVNVYCDRFQKYAENEYELTDDLGDSVITSFYIYKSVKSDSYKQEEGALTNVATVVNKIIDSESIDTDTYILSFKVGAYSYDFNFFTANYGVSVTETYSDGTSKTYTKYMPKDQVRSFCTNPPANITVNDNFTESEYKILEAQYIISQDTKKGVDLIVSAMKTGLVAGSVGGGYNVGTVYSTRQISLSDAMEEVDGKYFDFKNANALKTSFSYYMSPLLGKLEFTDTPIPTTIAEWSDIINAQNSNFVVDYKINLSQDFTSFESGLSEEYVNENGLKKTEKATFSNGVKAVQEVPKSRNPKSVVSYNMQIAYPYIFYKVGGNYKLLTNSLKIEKDYLYCISDDFIRDTGLNKITNRSSIGVDRDQLFLYYQLSADGQPVGVLLIGYFDECVIDTSDGNNGVLYATGRKIGFNNGYSDLLVFIDANPMLMYSTSEGGKKGYLPKNTAFLLNETETNAVMHNMTVHPELLANGTEKYESLNILDNGSLISELSKMENHDVINTNPDMFKFNILFTQIINQSKVADAVEDKNNNTTTPSTTTPSTTTPNATDPTGGLTQEELDNIGASHYTFVIIRNNRYINDAELISWLKTNTARSISYVDAEELLNKITGNFLDGLEKLTYEDWLSMHSIKSELENNKDMWLIRVLNVMAIVMGVFLIIFAILICLAYWIDIFNTLADFSILQFISFGNLYPVESKDLIPYVSESKSSTKYVTFKDVLIIAGICCGIGIIFMNTFTLVSWIIYLYNYIMSTLGGV